MINFTLTLYTAKTDERMVKYGVKMGGTNIYSGKVWVMANKTTATIDLTDVLINYYYRGENTLKPMVEDNDYVMEATASTATAHYIETITVYSIDSEFDNVSKDITLYPKYDSEMDGNLVTHLPANAPNGFGYKYLIYSNTVGAITLYNNGTPKTYSLKKGLNFISMKNNGTWSTDSKTLIVTDECQKPYYLLWLDHDGRLVCEGFTDRTEKTIEYNTNLRTDVHNADWVANRQSQTKYKLKSSNLTDTEYRLYGEMFKSPYLAIIDTNVGVLRYCNISDTTYTEKTRKTNDGKPVYMEVNVECAEHIKI